MKFKIGDKVRHQFAKGVWLLTEQDSQDWFRAEPYDAVASNYTKRYPDLWPLRFSVGYLRSVEEEYRELVEQRPEYSELWGLFATDPEVLAFARRVSEGPATEKVLDRMWERDELGLRTRCEARWKLMELAMKGTYQ